MISIKALSKKFGDIVAVDGISFDVPKGQIFGLLGPNGAGKSTTINMMVGVVAPDSGTIQIDNAGDASDPNVRRKLGNAPQALALYEELTAEENVQFFGRLYGMRGSRLADRVKWTLDLVGLTDRRKDRASTFSGGMKRRLNLACSLVHDPSILLLDEPTVGVDPQSRNLIFDKILMLKQAGHTIVYTTHYMEEAERLCDNVAIIDRGRILDMGTVNELISRHGKASVIEGEIDNVKALPVDFRGTVNGDRIRLESSRPLEEVAELSARGVGFRSLHVVRPDLESVFLNLTGRRIRD